MPTPRTPLLAALAATAAIVGSAALSCEGEPFEPEMTPCRCEVAPCAPATCPYELTLHASCAGDVAFVEVVIDGHLEQDVLVPGVPMTPCTRIPEGETGELIARGGKWIWGPIPSTCAEPGAVQALILECAAAVAP